MIQKDEIRQVLESAKALGIEFAELFFEDLGKVVHIVNATLCGNILNSRLCCVEQIYCMLYSFIVDEVRQSYSGFFFKER